MRKGLALASEPVNLGDFLVADLRANVVSVAKLRCAYRMDFDVVGAAQWQASPPDVLNLVPVVSHADRVHVVEIRLLTADAALFPHQASVHIAVNVVRQLDQRYMRRNVVSEDGGGCLDA